MPTRYHSVYIGLGSNLENPWEQLHQAVSAIKQVPDTKFQALSNIYKSCPLGPQEQPEFLNAVALISTALPPEKLLDQLQRIEKQQHRVRSIHWGPRTIDLDILLYADLIIKSKRLTVPHPEIAQRDFVLIPLADICPHLVFPGGVRLADLIRAKPQTNIQLYKSASVFFENQ